MTRGGPRPGAGRKPERRPCIGCGLVAPNDAGIRVVAISLHRVARLPAKRMTRLRAGLCSRCYAEMIEDGRLPASAVVGAELAG